jgi:signal transduction histidine kinase
MRITPFIVLPLGAVLIGLGYACNSLLTEMPCNIGPIESTLEQVQLAQQRITRDINLSRSIGAIRLRLDATYRDYRDAVHSLRKLLPSQKDSSTAKSIESVRAYLTEADCLLDDVEVFIRQAAISQNSHDYMLTLIRKLQYRLLENADDSGREITRYLATALEALRIDHTLSTKQLDNFRQRISQLSQTAPLGTQSDFTLLRQHLDKLYEVSPELDHVERKILDSPAATTLTTALHRVAESIQSSFRQGVRSQRVLLCVAGALCSYLALSFWQLRKMTSQLRFANEALENRVAERTVELAARNRDLIQAQKLEAVGQLAAGVAHELNTPMQYVHDNIEFLHKSTTVLMQILETLIAKADGSQPPQVWKTRWTEITRMLDAHGFDRLRTELPLSIQDALHGADRIIQIVRAMSHFTHPGNDDFRVVDLNSALHDAGIIAGNRCKHLELEFDLESDLPHVRCLPSQVNQVLLNLLVNAADAVSSRKDMEPELVGRITLRSHSDDDWVRLEVQDNGTGIPARVRDRIFEPFFTTKEVGQGTGQGLAIAWRIITEQHRGKIEVRTKPGSGTTFAVLLPIDGPRETCDFALESADLNATMVVA